MALITYKKVVRERIRNVVRTWKKMSPLAKKTTLLIAAFQIVKSNISRQNIYIFEKKNCRIHVDARCEKKPFKLIMLLRLNQPS